MSVNEQNLTGRKYRVWDAANNIWKRLSFWTKASDVELNDGTTVESAISTINTNLSIAIGFTGTTDEVEAAILDGEITEGMTVIITDD